MRHLNHRHTGIIHGFGNRNHFIDGDLMALGVHAIAQAHVVDSDFLSF
jgi:hypothetical protein